MRQKLKTALIVGVCILFAPIVAPLLVYLYATLVVLDMGEEGFDYENG